MTWEDDLLGALLESDLPTGARLVIRILAEHADFGTGRTARPSASTIAKHAAMTRPMVYPHLQRLEADGWIKRTGTGPRGVVIYAITPLATCRRPVGDLSGIRTQPRPLPKNNNNNSSVGT